MTRSQKTVWVATVTAASALRLWDLDLNGLWHDEAITAALIRLPFGEIVECLRRDGAPPLLYFLLKVMPGTANSESWLRLPGALASIATLPLVFRLGRELAGDRAGMWAMALTAVAPLQVHYAREARYYPLLSLATMCAVLTLLRYTKGGRRTDLVLYTLSAVVMVYLHNVAWFFVAAAGLVLIVGVRTAAQRWHVVVANVVIFAAFAPWMSVFLEQVQSANRLVGWIWAGAMASNQRPPESVTDLPSLWTPMRFIRFGPQPLGQT